LSDQAGSYLKKEQELLFKEIVRNVQSFSFFFSQNVFDFCSLSLVNFLGI